MRLRKGLWPVADAGLHKKKEIKYIHSYVRGLCMYVHPAYVCMYVCIYTGMCIHYVGYRWKNNSIIIYVYILWRPASATGQRPFIGRMMPMADILRNAEDNIPPCNEQDVYAGMLSP